MWDESPSPMLTLLSVIPSHHKVTQQILNYWKSFLDLKLTFVGSCRAEQLSLSSQQHIVSTIEDSVLRTEMTDLESQEEDADETTVSGVSPLADDIKEPPCM